jgi:DNA repair protein RadC
MKQLLTLKETSSEVTKPSDIFKNIKKIDIDLSQENFLIFALDTKNNIIKAEVLFKGGLAMCSIDPKTIFRFALLQNAKCIIIAHNHPSGDLHPSDEDCKVYDILKKAGKMIDIPVLDSIVFNKGEYYSMDS